MRAALAVIILSTIFAGPVLAQTTPPKATTPQTQATTTTKPTPPKTTTATKPKSAASLECSKQADAKGLHGKERKTFRAKCKKDFKSPA